MHKNLSDNTKLLVVSDTGMYGNENDVFAFGPVVKELEEMLAIFDSITWIGFNREDQIKNTSYVKVPTGIKTILLDKVGGVTLMDKFSIIKNYPKMYNIIHFEIKKHNFIHSRAPSNPAFIAMLISNKYPLKKFWFKYAGDWVGEASKFYKFQRKKLKSLTENCKITVNGHWQNQSKNIFTFENPCLTEKDRGAGREIIENKSLLDRKNYCFVGGLNHNKGIEKVLDAFKEIKTHKIGVFHIVGDGVLREIIEKKAKKLSINVYIHGSLPKEQVIEIYKQSHFIILPSQSEGFPKVIGEGMNYGCIPIVSDVSCIGQYVVEGINGFLIKPISINEIKKTIERSLTLNDETFKSYLEVNYKRADKYTYINYIKQIIEIFN